MSRRIKSHALTPHDIEVAILKLSNALRRDRALLYKFDKGSRILLIAVMIDPRAAFAKLVKWVKTADGLGSWDQLIGACDEYNIDLDEAATLIGGKIEDLRVLYEDLRGLAEQIKVGAT
jgi:hypothetical protein